MFDVFYNVFLKWFFFLMKTISFIMFLVVICSVMFCSLLLFVFKEEMYNEERKLDIPAEIPNRRTWRDLWYERCKNLLRSR